MTIKNIFRWIFATAGIFSMSILFITTLLYFAQQDSVKVANNRLNSYQLAQQVTLDSDTLTRLARTYITTLNAKYKDEYFRIVDIIEGKRERADGRKIAFRELLVENDFSPEELALLDKSVGLSIDLIGLEEQAFSLVADLEGVALEQLSPEQLVRWQKALNLLFDNQYHQERDNILAPIDEFMALLDNRTANAFSQVTDSVGNSVSTAAFVVILLLLILAIAYWLISHRVAKPLNQLKNAALVVAQGNLSNNGQLSVNSRDELGQLNDALTVAVDNLAGLISDVKTNADAAFSSSDDISANASSTSELVKSQKQSTDMIAAAAEELSLSAKEVFTICQDALEVVAKANEQVTNGSNLMAQTSHSVVKITANLETADASIDELTQSVSNVATVVDVINGIAEQTNLLALNAAIEAARAGEQGRGFAVVADEVRSLAQRTQLSTSEILQTIQTLQTKANEVSGSMSVTKLEFGNLIENSEQVSHSISNISDSFSSVTSVTENIATAAQEQSTVSLDISNQVNNMVVQVDEVDAFCEQSAGNANDLAAISSSLNNAVQKFTV